MERSPKQDSFAGLFSVPPILNAVPLETFEGNTPPLVVDLDQSAFFTEHPGEQPGLRVGLGRYPGHVAGILAEYFDAALLAEISHDSFPLPI